MHSITCRRPADLHPVEHTCPAAQRWLHCRDGRSEVLGGGRPAGGCMGESGDHAMMKSYKPLFVLVT